MTRYGKTLILATMTLASTCLASPGTPTPEDIAKARIGIDADGNGIRDDVDAHIQSLTTSTHDRAWLGHLARTYQNIQAEDRLTHDKARSYIKPIALVSFCSILSSDNTQEVHQFTKSLESKMHNTLSRKIRYRTFNKLLDGAAINIPSSTDQCLNEFMPAAESASSSR